MFAYLKYGVSVILAFVGVKMVLSDKIEISTELSLIVIVSVLAISIILSLVFKKKEQPTASEEHPIEVNTEVRH